MPACIRFMLQIVSGPVLANKDTQITSLRAQFHHHTPAVIQEASLWSLKYGE